MDGTVIDPLGTLLQRIIVDQPVDRRLLYWRAEPGAASATSRAEVTYRGGTLVVARDTTLSFDTYFNSFFEAHWRRHTSLRRIILRLTVEGTGILRVFRRAVGRKVLILEQSVISGPVSACIPSEAVSFRQYGSLCVELSATTHEVVFVAGSWWSDAPAPMSVGLAAVFCTFNREAELTRVVDTLARNPEVTGALARVIIVNQGRQGLAKHPVMQAAALSLGTKLALVEQANFGGAGGFGRGILTALDDMAATHVVLLDDDILLEPDSMLRIATFFAFCCRDIVVGGHMLDMVQPNLLYEAGAVISDRHWEFRPQHHGLAVDQSAALEALSQTSAIHYNGWWCCAFPLQIVEDHGMPLPCFIRGDDVEFGLRLHELGVPTVSMPGVAVWHEPFYLKLGSWQIYYETRNMLIAASLHLAPSGFGAVRRIGRHFVMNLLTFRYYSAALILTAVADFLRGPGELRDDPAKLHASLAAFRSAYPLRTTPRETVLETQTLHRRPRTRRGCIALLLHLMLRNAVVPSRATAARVLDMSKLDWLHMRGVEHIAIESWWENELPTVHRSREHHRSLLRQAIPTLYSLYRRLPAVAAAWRAAAPVLTSQAFWRDYLGVSACFAGTPDEIAADTITSEA